MTTYSRPVTDADRREAMRRALVQLGEHRLRRPRNAYAEAIAESDAIERAVGLEPTPLPPRPTRADPGITERR